MVIDNPEIIPVDAKELANMTDTQWYLIVFGPEDSEEVNTEAFKGSVNGGISEIVSKGVESMEAYDWGRVGVTREDGSTFGEDIEVKAEYIFRIKSVEYPEGKPPILKGTVTDYSADSNILGKLEQRLVLHFTETPTYKQDLGYQPLHS